MKPLYEYANEYQKVIDLIENCDEILPEHLEMLGDVSKDAHSKVVNVASYIKNLEFLSASISNAMDSIKKRKQATENKISSLKDYLKHNMQLLDLKEVVCGHFDVKIRNNNYALDIIDSSLIPDDYIREKLDVSIDKKKIINDLKNDVIVPGACFKTTSSVQIR